MFHWGRGWGAAKSHLNFDNVHKLQHLKRSQSRIRGPCLLLSLMNYCQAKLAHHSKRMIPRRIYYIPSRHTWWHRCVSIQWNSSSVHIPKNFIIQAKALNEHQAVLIFRELTSAVLTSITHTNTHTHTHTETRPHQPLSPMWLTAEWLQLNLCGSGQQYTAAGVWPSWHFLGRRRDAGVCDPNGQRSEGLLHFATGSLQSGNKVWSEVIMIFIGVSKAAKLSTISLSQKVQAEKGALQTYCEKDVLNKVTKNSSSAFEAVTEWFTKRLC